MLCQVSLLGSIISSLSLSNTQNHLFVCVFSSTSVTFIHCEPYVYWRWLTNKPYANHHVYQLKVIFENNFSVLYERYFAMHNIVFTDS